MSSMCCWEGAILLAPPRGPRFHSACDISRLPVLLGERSARKELADSCLERPCLEGNLFLLAANQRDGRFYLSRKGSASRSELAGVQAPGLEDRQRNQGIGGSREGWFSRGPHSGRVAQRGLSWAKQRHRMRCNVCRDKCAQ